MRPASASGRDTTEQLLLLFEPGRDRDLLADWLTEATAFEVRTADDGIPEEFDVCLCDRASLSAHRDRIAQLCRDADPVFVPVLLCVPADDVERAEEQVLGSDGIVDDVLGLPTSRSRLHQRVATLLRARRASRRLAEQEHQYRELVRLTPEAILVVTADTVAFANESAAATFDVADPSALAGRPVAGLDADGALAALAADVRAGTADGLRDLDLTLDDGTGIPAEAAGVQVTYDGSDAVQLVVRDLSEQRRRQQRMDLYARAVESAAQGITIADAEQDDEPLVYVNPAFERITGYELGEVLGENCRFLQGDGTDETAVTQVRDAIEDERPVSVELLNYRKDGTPFWNRLDVVPVTGEDGAVTHFLGLQRDVTAEKRREQRLAVLDRVLRHNLRNRMSVVRGYAGEIRDGNIDPERGAREIEEAADSLLELTDNLRRFRDVMLSEETALSVSDVVGPVASAVEDVRTQHPAADIAFDADREVLAGVHEAVFVAVEELLELAVDDDSAAADLTVAVGADDRGPYIDIRDHGGTFPENDVQVIVEGTETPLQHTQGVELWFVKWAVEQSTGSFVVTGTDPLEMRLRLPAPNRID